MTRPSSAQLSRSIFAKQDFTKCHSEVWVEYCIYEGIQQRIEVTKPANKASEDDRELKAIRTKWSDAGHHKERQPTHYEGACDDFSCFTFLGELVFRMSK